MISQLAYTEDEKEGLASVVRRAKAGDRDAYHELYVLYAERVRRYIRRVVLDEHLAEDLTQQIFTRLIASQLGTYEYRGPGTFSAWIFRVARNLSLDTLASSSRQRESAWDHDDAFEAPVRAMDLVPTLESALREMQPSLQEVAVLHHIRGVPLDEIAVRLDKSPAAVYSLNFRARRALQEAFRGADVVPVTAAA